MTTYWRIKPTLSWLLGPPHMNPHPIFVTSPLSASFNIHITPEWHHIPSSCLNIRCYICKHRFLCLEFLLTPACKLCRTCRASWRAHAPLWPKSELYECSSLVNCIIYSVDQTDTVTAICYAQKKTSVAFWGSIRAGSAWIYLQCLLRGEERAVDMCLLKTGQNENRSFSVA